MGLEMERRKRDLKTEPWEILIFRDQLKEAVIKNES